MTIGWGLMVTIWREPFFVAAVGTPGDEEIEECRSLGRRTAKLVKHLFA